MTAFHVQIGAFTIALASATSSVAADSCAALAGMTLGQNSAKVSDATIVTASGSQPEHCLAHVNFNDSTLRIEARLPTSGWNNRLAFIGGGGFVGAFSTPSAFYVSESIAADRYAVVSTNGGYDWAGPRDANYFKAEFAYDAGKLTDYLLLSEHGSLPIAKELIEKFYGSAPQKSYFEGCSTGGRQAMLLSQRYPHDFDGIVARAPAGNYLGLIMQFNRIAKLVRNRAHQLGTAEQDLLSRAVLDKCDALDGVADGIISKPAACNFDPTPLRCPTGQAGQGCLSDAQLETVNAVTTPTGALGGSWSHAGYTFAGVNSPNGWGEYIWPSPSLGDTVQGVFSDGFIRSFITRDQGFDTSRWNPDEWRAPLSLISSMKNATNPDLRTLSARGAKLILWNGTLDTSVSPRETERYYQQAVTTMGQAQADKVVEFFLAPGVGHCGRGPGPDKVDLMKAVSTWVEQGTPPSRQSLVHQKRDDAGQVTMARPVCKYPAYPRYNGTGDPSAAASFSCSVE